MRHRNWTPPSTGSVRAFEAAARLLSFTKAAGELNVTQSAVSHSVRELEARLGAKLFTRNRRQFALTESGRLYLPFVSEALARLRAGDLAIGDPARKARVLTVSVSPSFAAKWLVPRLGAFSAAHPDLDLRISATPQHIDFADGEIDMAVRHGDGNWPHLHCTQLCEEAVFPVCSPSLLHEKIPRTPKALAACTLIHHRSPDPWRDWLRAFGVDWPERAARGPMLNEMSLAIDAAVAGQGVALARSALADCDIAGGRLIRPMPQQVTAEFAYWIVCPPEMAELPRNVRFRDWLLSEARPV